MPMGGEKCIECRNLTGSAAGPVNGVPGDRGAPERRFGLEGEAALFHDAPGGTVPGGGGADDPGEVAGIVLGPADQEEPFGFGIALGLALLRHRASSVATPTGPGDRGCAAPSSGLCSRRWWCRR